MQLLLGLEVPREHVPREVAGARGRRSCRQIDAPNIFITDDIFWMNVQRGEEMARQIKAAGIKKYFTVQTRTDIICKFPHLIEMWKDCGNLAIFLGLESVTDEGLAAVNKKNKACNNVRRIEHPQGAGRRLHAELHRRPGLGPRRFHPPARLDRRDGRLQQRLLDPHAAARHRPVGHREAGR